MSMQLFSNATYVTTKTGNNTENEETSHTSHVVSRVGEKDTQRPAPVYAALVAPDINGAHHKIFCPMVLPRRAMAMSIVFSESRSLCRDGLISTSSMEESFVLW